MTLTELASQADALAQAARSLAAASPAVGRRCWPASSPPA